MATIPDKAAQTMEHLCAHSAHGYSALTAKTDEEG